ncbi:MAG: cytochrome c biogenesis protein ResB [Acidobacteriota bacterium]|nr:cytochrome c biogenesis protein ResB [Acidobacteriota bacterium]MDH3530467.1 cytochrome c biogenesis protein ResB [Acidobacteriota bacterium]
MTEESHSKTSILSKILDTAASVRFGIILLILLVLVCLLGMIIRQHNVAGFDEYIAEFSPFLRLLFNSMGLFDIYRSWYFNALLALLSMNIVLASVERFPKTLRFIKKRKLQPSVKWLERQAQYEVLEVDGKHKDVSKRIVNACRRAGWRQIVTTESQYKTHIFAESGVWNRLGAYPVHLALLAIFFGALLTSLFGFSGQMPLTVGQTSNKINETGIRDGQSFSSYRELPFTVTCLDLEQKLINQKGSIESVNSLDWLTHLEFRDEGKTQKAVVQLNRPFDYRGFRFFHSTFLPIGKARTVLIQIESEKGPTQSVKLKQKEVFALPDGYKLQFVDFRANVSLTRREENENSTGYQNPAAIFQIISPDGVRQAAFAFRPSRSTNEISVNTFNGHKLQLLDFEKVSEQHILFVSHDPGSVVVYTGFLLLLLSLAAVFFFSHQRVWCVIEEEPDKNLRITFGGDTNRNHLAFEEKFKKVTNSLS